MRCLPLGGDVLGADDFKRIRTAKMRLPITEGIS